MVFSVPLPSTVLFVTKFCQKQHLFSCRTKRFIHVNLPQLMAQQGILHTNQMISVVSKFHYQKPHETFIVGDSKANDTVMSSTATIQLRM